MSNDNITKIQYLQVNDKIYKVTDLNFSSLSIEAIQTDFIASDVPEEELWDINYFLEDNFKIRLVNPSGKAEIIDMKKWKKGHDLE